jgi:ABC-2 type transport system permease protein
VEVAVAETSTTVRLAHVLAPDDPLGAGMAEATDRLRRDPGREEANTTASRDRGAERREAAGYAVVATMVLFVFMNTVAGSSSWAEARELGVAARLRTTRARPWAIALGYGLGLATYAVLQAVVVLVAGAALYDLPLRSPVLLAAMVGVIALAAGGLGLLVATFLPSSNAGTTIAGPVAFVIAMLGGCLWPLEIVPRALALAGRVTPHLWAVEGLRMTAVHGDGLASVGGRVVGLSMLALMLGLAGGWRLSRQVGRI